MCKHRIAICENKLGAEELGSKWLLASFFLWVGSEVWQTWAWVLALVFPSCVTPKKLPNISMSQWPQMRNTENKRPYLTEPLVYEMSGGSKFSMNVSSDYCSKGLTLKTLKVASRSTFYEWNCKIYKGHLSIPLPQAFCTVLLSVCHTVAIRKNGNIGINCSTTAYRISNGQRPVLGRNIVRLGGGALKPKEELTATG